MSRSYSSVRPPHAVLYLFSAIFVLCLSLLATLPAHAQDEVGIYWDTGYTANTATMPTIPGAMTGYLVLHDQTGTGGVLGWEACIDVDGPGLLSSWDFQGQAVNVGSAPCLVVGYTAPLPPSANILLATFTVVATEPGPIEVTMKPAWAASVPGQMSYIPGDAPEDLIAMTTVTGQEVVAGLNGGTPWVTLSTTEIDFGALAIGSTASRFVAIQNTGPDPVIVAPVVQESCDFFGLPDGPGPFTVASMSSLSLEVTFTPVLDRLVVCSLNLGSNLPVVSLSGTGVAPIAEWYFLGNLDFGYVTVGNIVQRTLTLVNSGTVSLNLDAAFRDPCPDFQLLAGAGAIALAPGARQDFVVGFTPAATGYSSCQLALGDPAMSDVTASGTGRLPTTDWRAPTSYNFLAHYTDVSTSAVLTVTNTGETVFSILPALPGGCTAFSIVEGGGVTINLQPGQSHDTVVRFLSPVPGHFDCLLDMGVVVPAIRLDGDAVPPPTAVVVTPSVLVFPSTLAGQAVEQDLILSNNASYDLDLDVQLDPTPGVFSVVAGGGQQTLPSGGHTTVRIRFQPVAPVEYATSLLLGDPFVPVDVSGSGYAGTANCRIEPASLSFGDVFLGQAADLTVTVTNDGNAPMLVEPSTTAAEFFIDVAPTYLSPGQSVPLTVRYQPTSLGVHSGSLLLGDLACNAVSLLGSAVMNPALFEVTPDTVRIEAVPVGTIVDREVLVTNLAPEIVELNVRLLEPTTGFQVLQGGGPRLLYPGEPLVIVVRFLDFAGQVLATQLALGTGLPSVPLFAESYVEVPDCEVSAANLNFGEVPVGWRSYRYVGITNHSDGEIVLTPASSSPVYSVDGAPLTLAPGAAVTLEVVFQPEAIGSATGAISLGNTPCPAITCYGSGTPNQGQYEDLVGIYFDPGYQEIIAYAHTVGQQIDGYLVLSNPSTTGGVSGWECRVELTGPAVITGWTLAGQAINLASAPEFIVGTSEPLPFVNNALLASFSCVTTGLDSQSVFSLLPVRTPSLPDQMAWVAGDLPDVLLRMAPVTGAPQIAFINTSIVGVEAPTPRAELLGGQVDLSWPVPTGANEGCHVYRRLADQTAVRLTSEPISGTGTRLRYTDVTVGLEPGSHIFYSYSIIRGGVEMARSPEVEIALPALPAAITRLLPNRPNPFNPMTEIRFELSLPQAVSLKIYDVTGRLVRDLASGSLPAGPHTRVWQGRDDSGRQVPSGAYYVRLVTQGKVDRRKIMLLK